MSALNSATRQKMRAHVLSQHALQCHYCLVPLSEDSLTVEHVVPRALGGSNARWNLVPACHPCNSARGHTGELCPCDYCCEAWLTYRLGNSRPDLQVRRRR